MAEATVSSAQGSANSCGRRVGNNRSCLLQEHAASCAPRALARRKTFPVPQSLSPSQQAAFEVLASAPAQKGQAG